MQWAVGARCKAKVASRGVYKTVASRMVSWDVVDREEGASQDVDLKRLLFSKARAIVSESN